jgi:3-oxoacyl-[acyl-carrier-protein] synthase II
VSLLSDGPRSSAGTDLRRVVITGVGTVSAIGVGGADVVRSALEAGVPRISPIRAFSTEGCRSHLGAEVGDLASHLDPQELRRLSRVSQFAVIAARVALADARLEPGGLAGLGVVLGSAYGDISSCEEFARGFLARGPLGLSPIVFPNTVMNAMGAQVAIAVGARGPMLTVTQADVAGDLAVAQGARLIATGRAPAVLAGGVDELCPTLFRELIRLGVTSPRGHGPEGCWPFDRRANGTVPGEGATLVLLEAAELALSRGARVYAEVRGAAWGNLPSPVHGFPASRHRDPAVFRRALTVAGVDTADVDALYLTGSGAPAQDACELDLINWAFAGSPGRRPTMTALTPLAGNHAGLGGLRVAAATAVTVAQGLLPSLPDLVTPVRDDLAFATSPVSSLSSNRIVVVHTLARGGSQVVLVFGPMHSAEAEGVAA